MKRSDSRAPRKLAAFALLLALVPLSGCSYLFGDKRTSYDYKPDYGVDSAEFRRSLDVLGTEMVPHNSATLLQNGDEFFPAMLEAIRSAQASVNMEMFIFDDGEVAGEFARALADKAREGVEVRLLIDGYGSSLGDLEGPMKAAGVKVREYKPLRIYTIYKIGNRTHRKILTVDGKIGFTGGVGIDDRWKGDARNPNEWRETMVKLEGPVVAQLQSIFMEDWVHTTGEVLHGCTSSSRRSPRPGRFSRRRSAPHAAIRARWRSSSTTWESRRREGRSGSRTRTSFRTARSGGASSRRSRGASTSASSFPDGTSTCRS